MTVAGDTPTAAVSSTVSPARPIRLRPIGSALARMVFVPGGAFQGVDLADSWMDQYEVTNRQFKAFVIAVTTTRVFAIAPAAQDRPHGSSGPIRISRMRIR